MGIDGKWIETNETKEFKEGPYLEQQEYMTFKEYLSRKMKILKFPPSALRDDMLKQLEEVYSLYGDSYKYNHDMNAEKLTEHMKQADDIVTETKSEIDIINAEIENIFGEGKHF